MLVSLLPTPMDSIRGLVPPGALDLQGTAVWSPDGQSLAVAASVDSQLMLFRITVDGSTPAPLVKEYPTHPIWAPESSSSISAPTWARKFP